MTGPVQRLTLDDLSGCLALARDRDWPAEEHKWRLLFDVGTVFGLRDAAGELVGSTILTRYGDTLAAISMVLVATRHGGRGLGRRLMDHAIAVAEGLPLFLNATSYGRPLYEKLGFTVHPDLRAWATGRGVTQRTSTAVMALGITALPGDRERWFAPLMQALG